VSGRPVRFSLAFAGAAAWLALALPVAARAQSLQGVGGGFNVQRRIFYQDAVHEQTGMLVGGSGSLGLGPLRLGVSGVMGTLKSTEGSAAADVKVRSSAVRVQYALAPGIAVGVQAEARRFEADAGVTVWRLIGVNARLEPGLGLAGLRALADVSVLPASSVVNGPKLKMALQATVGASFAPRGGPLVLRIGYRFERFDLEATGASPERYEQFRGLVVEAGLSLGR
jgi:hypothetical protein